MYSPLFGLWGLGPEAAAADDAATAVAAVEMGWCRCCWCVRCVIRSEVPAVEQRGDGVLEASLLPDAPKAAAASPEDGLLREDLSDMLAAGCIAGGGVTALLLTLGYLLM